MNYTFEKVRGEDMWQVRLKGEYVMHTDIKDSKLIDEELAKGGYTSREHFFQESVKRNLAAIGY
jgi:hypothetical protein